MNNSPVANLSLRKIIERKLSFLLNNEIAPWDGDNSDLGERDALQKMLDDSEIFTESEFETKYMAEVVKLNKRIEGKVFSIENNDDYYESFNNTVVMILEIIDPVNLYYPDEEGKC